MVDPGKGRNGQKSDQKVIKKSYEAPELNAFGSVMKITNGPNTAPADAQGTGGLFGAGGTS